MTKATYEAPVLRAHGTVEAITQANNSSDTLDFTFSAGTSIGDVTVGTDFS